MARLKLKPKLFLYGDFALFRRLFRATAQIEEATPFFALAILRNILAMVFLVATIVLFSSAMTAAIGAFFTDLDLDIYHAAPRRKLTLVISRWMKTLAQSATIIFAFIVPMFVAFARQYDRPWTFYPIVLLNLALLLTIPVTLGSLTIVLLVRWFPVQRVHQIVATIAILVLTVTVVAFRVSRPERLFTEVTTDNLVAVLRAIELPSIDLYPGGFPAHPIFGRISRDMQYTTQIDSDSAFRLAGTDTIRVRDSYDGRIFSDWVTLVINYPAAV